MHMVEKCICEYLTPYLHFLYFFTGSRLQLLKEQLQKQMKVKRAEVRKIQESQRKLDNEEMSEEEEEEMTDEEGMTKIMSIICYW